jgi:16S rRNA (cytosine967-C5)-methyltransferase
MNARDIVLQRIAAQIHRYPNLDLAPLEISGLDARDAALAQAIDHAVKRRWLTLQAVAQCQVSRPWHELESKVQAALLVGVAQLLFLERLPDHAVINETVEWAKRRVRPKAGGLINAVLRKIAASRGSITDAPGRLQFSADEMPLHDGRVMQFSDPPFAESFISRLSQQTSHSEELITSWLTTFGQEKMIRLAMHSLVHAPIIVHGATGPNNLLQPHDQSGFFVFIGDRSQLSDLLTQNPDIIVQDSTSAAPVAHTSKLPQSPAMIIDYCAGRGTKSRQLECAYPQARIIATDVDAARFETLRNQFADHERVKAVEFATIRSFDGQADLLLLDVPCSNTGVLARRVEAKYRISSAVIKKTVDLQRQIVADSISLLAPRGRILYSTCSIEPAENQHMAEWIAKWHRMKITHMASRMPEGLPGEPMGRYCDGGFFAVLER